MRIINILLINVIFLSNIIAQSPEKFSYQAVVRDNQGNLIKNQEISIQVSLIQSEVDGTTAYSESHLPTTNSNGVLTIEIGAGSSSDDFSLIDWTFGPYFIKTEIDLNGGNNYTISHITQLLSVPYALYAKTAERVKNLDINGNETAFEGWDKDAANDFSGEYDELTNKPTTITAEQANAIITNTSKISNVQADWNATSGHAMILNKPNRIAISDTSDIAKSLVLSTSGGKKYELIVDEEGNLTTILSNVGWQAGDNWYDLRDGQSYGTVLIGDQVWMTNNMNFNIPLNWDGQLGSLISGSRYYDDNLSYQDHGRLYYWDIEVVNSVCPSGWHVPSDEEWMTLVSTTGGFDIAGGRLKKVGVDFWKSPNNDAIDEFGFNAISTGMVMYDFNLIDETGFYMTSTEDTYGNIWVYKFDYNSGKVIRYSSMKYGFGVRCIKDQNPIK